MKAAALFTVYSALLFFGFSAETKLKAIKERGCYCQRCGKNTKPDKLYPHHILPESMGGGNTIDNLYLACDNCHRIVDDEAQQYGKLVDTTVIDTEKDFPERIKDRRKYQKAKDRFRRQGFRSEYE